MTQWLEQTQLKKCRSRTSKFCKQNGLKRNTNNRRCHTTSVHVVKNQMTSSWYAFYPSETFFYLFLHSLYAIMLDILFFLSPIRVFFFWHHVIWYFCCGYFIIVFIFQFVWIQILKSFSVDLETSLYLIIDTNRF